MLLNLAILLKKGVQFEPILYIPNQEGPLFEEAKKRRIRYISYFPPPWHIYPIELKGFAQRYKESYSSLYQALLENPCDLMLVNTHVNIVPAGIAVEMRIPMIVWLHGVIDTTMVKGKSEFSYFCTQWLLKVATKIVSVSNWTAEFYNSFYGIQDYSIVHNWLPNESYKVDADSKYQSGRFVCLGTHEEIKGIDILIDAAIELKRRGNEFKIDLFGDGPLSKAHQERVVKSALQDNIFFHGYVPVNTSIFKDKTCLISPSYVESFGMTLIEGMAQHTPIIATRSGGPNEIVEDGYTGFLIDRGDYIALADKMEIFLKDSVLAKDMGEAGYKSFRSQFSEAGVTEKIHSVLFEAISNYTDRKSIYNLTHEMMKSLLWKYTIHEETFIPVPTMNNYLSSLRLEAGLLYKIILQKNILTRLKILAIADFAPQPLILKLSIYSSRGQLLRVAYELVSEFGYEIWLSFEFLPITDIRNETLTLEIVLIDGSGVIRLCEKNQFERKIKRIYRRGMGLLGLKTYGNQLCFESE